MKNEEKMLELIVKYESFIEEGNTILKKHLILKNRLSLERPKA